MGDINERIQLKDILKLNKIQIFGPIHKLPYEEFKKHYYAPETVHEAVYKIIYSLKEGYGNNNKLIIGEPGCGKPFLFII